MLIEQKLSHFAAGVSLAIIIPPCIRLLEQPDYTPGKILVAGSVIGATAVFMGSLCSISYSKRSRRFFHLVIWGMFSVLLCIAIGFGLCIVEQHTLFAQLTYGVVTCLPLATFIVTVFNNRKAIIEKETM